MQANIKGTTMPILEVTLNDGEEVISTHGELAWMTQSIQLSQRMGTGGPGGGGLRAGLKRGGGGGGIFVTHYGGPGAITFAAKAPGHIMPVEIEPGQSYFVHRHGWLGGSPGIVPSMGFQQSFRGGRLRARARRGSSCPASSPPTTCRRCRACSCIRVTSACSRAASGSR